MVKEVSILESIGQYLEGLQHTLGALPMDRIQDVADLLLSASYAGSTVFTLGNGGSAATASHFACDLAKGTITTGRPRFRAVALTDNVPLMTAWSNDVSYDDVFAGQLSSLMGQADVLVAFSPSGNSANVLRAVELARSIGGITVGFSGFDGGRLSTLVDLPVVVPCDCPEQIEDMHFVLCHLTCTVLREQMRQIEPPLWRMLASAGWQKERQSVMLPLPSMSLEGEGCW